MRSPDILLDEQTETLLARDDYDYESIPIFKNYKIAQLKKILEQAIERKYKISFAKGMMIASESIIFLILMVSMMLKANILSIIYLLFIIKAASSKFKAPMLVRVNTYIALNLTIQYIIYLLNLTASTSPAPFPIGFEGYPRNKD